MDDRHWAASSTCGGRAAGTWVLGSCACMEHVSPTYSSCGPVRSAREPRRSVRGYLLQVPCPPVLIANSLAFAAGLLSGESMSARPLLPAFADAAPPCALGPPSSGAASAEGAANTTPRAARRCRGCSSGRAGGGGDRGAAAVRRASRSGANRAACGPMAKVAIMWASRRAVNTGLRLSKGGIDRQTGDGRCRKFRPQLVDRVVIGVVLGSA